jgi:2-polyprenyl-6-methoxyphenol hydroxylase-like FAD-dependent oxidoreductase
MSRTDVLIAGAGPTGLVLALWLTRLGVRVRVVDQAPEPGTTSRALGVQARTLELYRTMGLDQAMLAGGVQVPQVHLWVRGEERARVALGAIGAGLSPYPYLLVYPQDRHEKMLTARLEAADVRVERSTTLVGFEVREEGVTARLRHGDGSSETCEAKYLAGCDGARSAVRQGLHLEYPGGTYSHVFYVADVEATGPTADGELHLGIDDADFIACFPLQGGGVRIVGALGHDADDGDEGGKVDWSDVNQRAIERVRLDVRRVNWFSTYRVHHRVASSFRVGRAFLLGDAAHIHSPVGGQGMNTGIGDAVNLAWKLAAVLRGRAGAPILDSYEAERVSFARRLVRTTDKAFEVVSSEGELARRARADVVPRFVAAALRWPRVRRLLFETISQIKVNYRASALNEGRAGAVRGGDRLPWVPSAGGTDNFAPLTSLDWQVHVYGAADEGLRAACEARRLPVHVFAFDDRAAQAGVARDAAYVVRPDGYVGLAAPSNAAERLGAYLDARGVRPFGA